MKAYLAIDYQLDFVCNACLLTWDGERADKCPFCGSTDIDPQVDETVAT